MTTKEFIEMLKKADPSGNAHIRMEGGFPVNCSLKEGYWDGPFSYLDKDGNYVYSINGMKVDVSCRDIEGFVENHFDFHNSNNWEEIKSKFKFELSSYCNKSQRDEKENSVLNIAKEAWNNYYEIHQDMFDRALQEMTNNALKGWRWFQNKEIDKYIKGVTKWDINQHFYYTWKILDEKGKSHHSNIHMTDCVIYSGKWERVDNNVQSGYYEWVFKTN